MINRSIDEFKSIQFAAHKYEILLSKNPKNDNLMSFEESHEALKARENLEDILYSYSQEDLVILLSVVNVGGHYKEDSATDDDSDERYDSEEYFEWYRNGHAKSLDKIQLVEQLLSKLPITDKLFIGFKLLSHNIDSIKN